MIRLKQALLPLVFLAVPFTTMAEDPPAGSLRLYLDFSKSVGLFDYYTSESGSTPDNSAQAINNVDFRINHTLTRRNGLRLLDSQTVASAQSRKNLIDVFISSNNIAYLMVRKYNRYQTYRIDDPSNGTVSVIGETTPMFEDKENDTIAIENSFYVIFPSTFIRKWEVDTSDQLIDSSVNNVPSGRMASLFLGHLLIAGSTTPATRNRVFYSTSSDIELFPAFNYFDLPPVKNNDILTALGESLLGVLPIYTRNSTRALSGTVLPETGTAGNTTLRTVSETIGCIHHKTVKNLGNRQYFYSGGENDSQPGIYYFNGVGVIEATKQIRNYFRDEISITTAVIPSGFIYQNAYCLLASTPNGITISRQVCVDEDNRIFVSSMNIDDVAVHRNIAYSVSAATPSVSFVPTNAIVAQYDSGTHDYGNGISWQYQTKDYDMSGEGGGAYMANKKVAQSAYLEYRQGVGTFTITANYDFNRDSTTFTIDTSTPYLTGGSIKTVSFSTKTVVSKLTFPSDDRFNYVNFELGGNFETEIGSLEFYALPEPKE